jgi:hypothetical protein
MQALGLDWAAPMAERFGLEQDVHIGFPHRIKSFNDMKYATLLRENGAVKLTVLKNGWHIFPPQQKLSGYLIIE